MSGPKGVKLSVFKNGHHAYDVQGASSEVAQFVPGVDIELAKQYVSEIKNQSAQSNTPLTREQELVALTFSSIQRKIVVFVKDFQSKQGKWPVQADIRRELSTDQRFAGPNGNTNCLREVKKLENLNVLKTSGAHKPKVVSFSDLFNDPLKFLQGK